MTQNTFKSSTDKLAWQILDWGDMMMYNLPRNIQRIKSILDASAKLTRAKLNKRSGDADLSKEKSGLESPPEFQRSWRRGTKIRRNQAELSIHQR
ncbi:hypothetical protein Tco_0889891 [Tanacetum coccineum]